jgi:integrase
LADREAAEAAAKAAAQQAVVAGITFKAVAEAYVTAHEAGWKNDKHIAQWKSTLKAYVYPRFGDVPVMTVATSHVLAALEPIWREKPETASRLRGRIEAILDYAKARQWRTGENPAAWRGHLVELLPSRKKIAPIEHHAALPWREMGAFLPKLRAQVGVGARALEFAIFTAARSGEVFGARWREIDMIDKVWTVPAERMKGGREHRVPLSKAALELLQNLAGLFPTDPDSFVFPSVSTGRGLSNMAMTMTLRRMKRADLTAHGFRSTFRDWAAEATGFPGEVAEAALAHVVGDKVEAAYRRGDLFEKRRRLMNEWAAFCCRPPVVSSRGAVVQMHAAKA